MAQFALDTSTVASTTLITARTTDSGHSWVNFSGTASPAPSSYNVSGGVIANGASGPNIWRMSALPSVADVSLTQDWVIDSATAYNVFGACARLNAAGNAGYAALYVRTSNAWILVRIGASMATTTLATSSTVVYSNGATPSIELRVTGSGDTVSLELKIGGTTLMTATDTDAARVTAAGYVGMWFNSGAAQGAFLSRIAGDDLAVASATAVTLTGPITSVVGSPSSNFTVGANGTITGTVTVTPSAGGGGGTFTPATVDISAGTPTATFTYTAASSGAKSISVTNNGGLTNPGAISLTATSTAATALTLSGPPGGYVGEASVPFTVAANGTLAGTVVVTPSAGAGGGTFTPTTVSLTTGATSSTFTYTPATAGNKSISITNDGGLTNPSAAAFAATAADVQAPFPPAVADRVRDTASTASGSSIAISNSAPTGFRTFAASFAVGTKAIPVLCEDASGNWMVASCTLTNSTTLAVESITSSSAAGAAPTFDGGTKTVFCVMPAKLAFKARHIDLSDYAIYPDFSLDSTAGVQQAILDAYNRRIEKIIAPPGHFKLAGSLVGSGNCQVYLPNTREATPNRSIWIEGACPPNFQNQGLWPVVSPNNGTVFESVIAGSGSQPSVFGAEQGDPADARPWNYTNFLMTNCGVRVKANNAGAHTMTAIDMRYVSQVPVLDNLMLGVNVPLSTMTNPTGGNSFGIKLPPVNNHAWVNIGLVYISGFETGINATEHTYIDHALLLGCVNGVALQAANHASRFNMLTMEHVKNSIVVNGNHPLSIGLYETEHNGSIAWCTHAYDILVNSGSRVIAFNRTSIVLPGTGYVDDASNFHSSSPTIYKIFAGPGSV